MNFVLPAPLSITHCHGGGGGGGGDQHVYIPVLPPSLLMFCCAPMPFVVGILRSSVPELNKLSGGMDEVTIVDIDRNKFLSGTLNLCSADCNGWLTDGA